MDGGLVPVDAVNLVQVGDDVAPVLAQVGPPELLSVGGRSLGGVGFDPAGQGYRFAGFPFLRLPFLDWSCRSVGVATFGPLMPSTQYFTALSSP